MTLSRPGLVCVLALLCVLGCALPASARSAEIIVRRDAGLSAAERADIRADAGVRLDRMLKLPDTELVTAPAVSTREALAALNADPDVRYAEPVVRFSAATNDPHYDKLWNLENTGQVIQRRFGVEDADSDVPEAWAVTRGAGQTVAIIDTGVDLTHPDLQGRIAAGGRSFVAGVSSAGDDQGHGTNVAGVIAATADNSVGVAGVAPETTLLPLKALDSTGGGNSRSIGEALAYAGDLGIRVVNLSVSGPNDSQFMRDAIAAHPETLYVVAAGNGTDYGSVGLGDNNDGALGGDSGPQYPCNFPLPNVICVGATNNVDEVSAWSNYGVASVDLFAPGESIYTTRLTGADYGVASGTSLAAPMVAAEAALLLASRPILTGPSLRRLVLRSVDPIETAAGRSATGGRANAGALLNASVSDADADGALDELDNCPSVPDRTQADVDADTVGDVCDPTPRGDDVDGDAKPALDDRCPLVASDEPDGCPRIIVNPPSGGATPTATPQPTTTPRPTTASRVVTVSVKLTPKRCPAGRTCRKAARVTVKVTRAATVSIRLEQRIKRKGRWVYKRLATKSLKATFAGRSMTVARGLTKGPYRVTATVAGKSKSRSFQV